MKNKAAKDELIRTAKFVLFSASAGIIQVVSFSLLNELLHLSYWVSYLISLTLSVLWNFTLNRKYTFQSAANVPIAMLKVAGFYLVFTPLSAWLGQLAASSGWNGYLVEGLTMISNFVLEFLYFKYVVFRKDRDEK